MQYKTEKNLLAKLATVLIPRSFYFLSAEYVLLIALILLSNYSFAQSKGINFQAVVKAPNGSYPSVNGITVKAQIMDQFNDCILREETHSGVSVTNGFLNLVIGGSGASTPAGKNPSPVLSIVETFDNSTVRNGLNCVDNQDNIATSGQTYTPASNHSRKLRIRFFINSDEIVADFNLRSVPFAVNSETLSGKTAAQFVQTSTNITQNKVETLLTDPLYTSLQNISSSNTGAFKLPTGTTGQQPSSPVVGMIRFNSTNSSVEVYDGSAWGSVGGSAAGSTYLAANGTASAPGITFNSTGNNDNGIFLPADNTIALSTNGTERFRVDSNGNVGIGTSNPIDKLSFGIPIASSTSAMVNLSNTAIVNGSSGGTFIGANPSSVGPDFLNFQIGGVDKFKVDSRGAVTIQPSWGGGQVNLAIKGTPGGNWGNLSIQGTGGASHTWTLGSDWATSKFVISDSTGTTTPFTIEGSSPNDSLRITTTGLGVGTNSPQANLELYTGNAFDTATKNNILKVKNPSCTNGQGSGIGFAVDCNGTSSQLIGAQITHIRSGSNTRGDLAFSTRVDDSSGLTEKLRITSTGSVGIGTTSPNTTLDVNGVIRATGSMAASTGTGIELSYWNSEGSITAMDRLNSLMIPLNLSGQTMKFGTGSGGGYFDRMIIDSAGNVGIGTGTPDKLLTITGNQSQGILKVERQTASTNTLLGAMILKVKSSSSSVDGLSSSLIFRLEDTSAVEESLAEIHGIRDGADNSGALMFMTHNAGTGTERMRINRSGNIGIGTASPSAKLDVNGAIKSTAVSNASTTIDFSTGNLQYTSSDCGALTLTNLKSGGTYNLSIQGTAGGTCTIANAYSDGGTTSLTVKLGSSSLVQTASKHLIISFMVMGSYLYVTSVDGY